MFAKNTYIIKGGIKVFSSSDKTVEKIINFYSQDPFPGYELTDDRLNILKKGDENPFTFNLKKHIGNNKKNTRGRLRYLSTLNIFKYWKY